MKKTYIFGHKKPDSDSVLSAIAYSYLKNQLGDNTEPRILGDINKETAYALKYFNLPEPRYLNDVKLQIKDINYHKGFVIQDIDSIYKGYQMMINEGLTGIPVIKKDGTFSGLITMKDLSKTVISETIEDLYTSYNNLMSVLKGEEILHFDDEIIGKLFVAAFKSTHILNEFKAEQNTIFIVGDRHSVIEYAIESCVKLIIITGNCEIKAEHIELARQNKVNIIRTQYDTYHVARLVTLTNYIKTLIRSYNPTKFDENDFVDDVVDINNRLKHTNYPIVNKQGKCLGLLKITDLSEKKPKEVILVDHNEKLQSADGIEEAHILEIIDHHNLGSITTSTPINFRNMAVGSTCTIVYTLFKERNIDIPKEIAGALISGILSDTLILKSPTATKKDKEAVEELALIAEINYQEYGMDLLKAGTSLDGMTTQDVLFNDYKLYDINNKKFAIGQFFTMNFEEIEKDLNNYINVLNKEAEANNFQLVALYVTDIVKNGSYVIYNSKAEGIMKIVYEDSYEGYFVEGCLSRKKHIVPLIMSVLEN